MLSPISRTAQFFKPIFVSLGGLKNRDSSVQWYFVLRPLKSSLEICEITRDEQKASSENSEILPRYKQFVVGILFVT